MAVLADAAFAGMRTGTPLVSGGEGADEVLARVGSDRLMAAQTEFGGAQARIVTHGVRCVGVAEGAFDHPVAHVA